MRIAGFLSAWLAETKVLTFTMRLLRTVGIFFILVFVGAAALAPWLYKLAYWAAALHPSLEALAKIPFHRYVNRSLLGLGLIGVWLLLREIGIQSWTDIGLGKRASPEKLLGRGFLLGFISLACAVLLVIAFGARTLKDHHSWPEITKHLGQAGLAAMVVASIEELFFRGSLFGALRKAMAWPAALLASSAIYALLHFFEPPPPIASIDWASGFVVLARMMHGFASVEKLVPGFFNLTLAGIILGLAYQRSGSLYFSIGLHAGWIFWLKSYGFVTQGTREVKTWFWGTGRLIDGWLALVILAVILIFLLQQKPQAMSELAGPTRNDYH